jgi:hypothetical protein
LYAGVAQGSILGPLLWNLVYNGLLKELNTIPKMNAVAFADDLAVILGVAKWCAENCRKFGTHLEKSAVTPIPLLEH